MLLNTVNKTFTLMSIVHQTPKNKHAFLNVMQYEWALLICVAMTHSYSASSWFFCRLVVGRFEVTMDGRTEGIRNQKKARHDNFSTMTASSRLVLF